MTDGEPVEIPSPFPPFSGRRRRTPEEGTLEVHVVDEQHDVVIDLSRWQLLTAAALRHEGMDGDAELALHFVDEAIIAELNQRFLGHEGPTDVLAFPLEDDLVEPGRFPDSGTTGPIDPRARGDMPEIPLLLGDVVVCPAVAARNAPTNAGEHHDGSLEDELALLIVHGVLHILGHDHAEDEEAAVMRAKEVEILARHHRGAPA